MRARYLRWGSTDEELNIALPGDELVPDADLTATRAITVRAPPDGVWPWIAQLGQGRGGFYSYDFIDNVMGCDIHSADRIVSEWQAVNVGDAVRLHPEVGLSVAVAEPGRALVLRGGVPIGRTPAPYDFTWAFVLRGQADGTTRLVVRERYSYARPSARLLVEPTEFISFVMSRRMLRGIKERAEHAAVATSTSAATTQRAPRWLADPTPRRLDRITKLRDIPATTFVGLTALRSRR
ncbi:MAG: SRPBCC family protein [Solirubrobacteraceae bacterium]